jgi:predicted enzyme related to lactoylglutathione lyase
VSTRDGYKHGTPCWVDHSSKDPAAAAKFYGGLFGWETEDQMPPDAPGHYFMATLNGRDVAALGMGQAEDAPPMWNTYIWVDSADEAATRAQTAGGTPTGEPFDIFDAGRMAVLQDHAGAWFCIWQAGNRRGAGIVNEPGAWCWSELQTRDAEGSKRFYGEVFGWRAIPIERDGDEYTTWQLPDSGEDRPIGGMSQMTDDRWPAEVPSHWSIAFAVSDTDAVAADCEERGGGVAMPPFETPFGRTSVLLDPLGASFAVIRLTDATG